MDDWRRMALALPSHHGPLCAGDAHRFIDEVASLSAVRDEDLVDVSDEAARLAALDVLMVEAAVRRHDLALPPPAADALAASTEAVARRGGIPPILSYPLYIRTNPTDLDHIRRFTPLEAEFRFIRMHRLIEDIFDGLIERLGAVLDATDGRAALAAAMPGLRAGLRRVNRTMAGFRGPVRMPRDAFVNGFRPYFEPKVDPATGETLLEGPSGLQSPTYRIIATQIGYRDPIHDGWTARIARCHDPATRARLLATMAARDTGRSLTARVADPILGPAPDLPHLHPDYGAHISALLGVALARGYVSGDILDTFAHFSLPLGEWPAEAPVSGPVPPIERPATMDDRERSDLTNLVELEAMLFGMHLEHVAVAAVQIGAVRGTGGTSGVEFLLLATFRRAFPALWVSGLGVEIAAGMR